MSTTTRNNAPTVLVVDDISMMGELMRTMLRRCGCEIVGSATNADDAARAYHRHRPDIVFLDIMMPGKNGLEVLREIRANNPNAFVVMVSAEPTMEHVKGSMDLGAKAFLRKPISPGQLKAILDRFHDTSRSVH